MKKNSVSDVTKNAQRFFEQFNLSRHRSRIRFHRQPTKLLPFSIPSLPGSPNEIYEYKIKPYSGNLWSKLNSCRTTGFLIFSSEVCFSFRFYRC